MAQAGTIGLGVQSVEYGKKAALLGMAVGMKKREVRVWIARGLQRGGHAILYRRTARRTVSHRRIVDHMQSAHKPVNSRAGAGVWWKPQLGQRPRVLEEHG